MLDGKNGRVSKKFRIKVGEKERKRFEEKWRVKVSDRAMSAEVWRRHETSRVRA